MKILIGYKNSNGKYKKGEYNFNDQRHFDNWEKKFESYGNKIISQEEIKD